MAASATLALKAVYAAGDVVAGQSAVGQKFPYRPVQILEADSSASVKNSLDSNKDAGRRRGVDGPSGLDGIGASQRLGWRGAGAAGVPVVAGASSGIHVMALRSYLNPLALLSASFVEFITR
jgi:hypothetical protein